MNEEAQPTAILGITVTGEILIPPGLRQAEVLALLQALNARVKKVLDNLLVQ